MKKILLIYHDEYPWDIRIEKFAKALTEKNYEVHLVCRNDFNKMRFETKDGIYIHRPKYYKIRVFRIPAFFNPVWLSAIWKIARIYAPELIIVRDLPLCLSGLIIGKIIKIPIIFDMAENYPEAIKIWKETENYSIFDNIIRNVNLLKIVEAVCLKYCTRTIVVATENLKRLEGFNIENHKLRSVMNTPSRSLIEKINSKSSDDIYLPHGPKLIYIGGFENHRGLSTLINGMTIIVQKIPDTILVLVGDGNAMNSCKKLSESNGLKKNIIFTGRIKFPKTLEYIKKCDLGVIPHLRCPHTDTTLPNKLFDYMGLGKAVLVSNCLPLVRVVNEENCGLIFKSGDPGDFSDQAIKLIENEGLRTAMGKNGEISVANRYNWDRDKAILIDTINEII